jgi:hypothetical protein
LARAATDEAAGGTTSVITMSDVLTHDRLFELSTEHREIRRLVDLFDHVGVDRVAVAERLCVVMAGHRASITEPILNRAAQGGAGHEQQARLLMAATHGAEELIDRLRLPAHDRSLVDGIVEGLRTLVHEHERLELELVEPLAPTRER